MSTPRGFSARARLLAALVLLAAGTAAATVPYTGVGKQPGDRRVSEGAVRVSWKEIHPPGCKPANAETARRWCEIDDDGVITVRNPVRFNEVMKLEERRLETMRAHPDAEYNEHELYHLGKQVRAGRAATNALKRATDKFDAAERERLRSPGVKKAPKASGAHKRRVAEIYRCRKDFNPNSEAAAREADTGWGYVCSVSEYRAFNPALTARREVDRTSRTRPMAKTHPPANEPPRRTSRSALA